MKTPLFAPAALVLLTCLSVPAAGQGAAAAAAAKAGTPRDQQPAVSPGRAEAYYEFLLGRRREMAGDIDAASEAFERAAALDPASPAILAELAALSARQNRARQAMAYAEKALALDPAHVEAHRVLGFVYSAYARSDSREAPDNAATREAASKAIQHLEAASRGPGFPEAGVLLTLGRLYVRTQQSEQAVPVLTRLLEQVGPVSEVALLLAEAYVEAGHLEQAASTLEPLAADQPELYASLGELYERAGRWNEAASAYGKGLARSPGNSDLQTNLAFAMANAGNPADLPRARELATAALEQRSNDPRALYVLSQVQRAMRDLAGAEATARRLIAVTPNGISGPFVLAQVFEQRGEHEKVVDLLEPIVTGRAGGRAGPADRDFLRLAVHLGAAYVSLGKTDDAIRVFEQARRASPDDPAVEAAFIEAHVSGGRLEQATALAAAAAARYPGDLRFTELRARSFVEQGQPDRAVEVMREAVKQRPDDPAMYATLSEILVSSGRAAEAHEVVTEAERRFPDDANVQFELGAVLERQGEYADAERAFKKAIALDPSHAPALNYLGYMLAERGEQLDAAVGYIERALAIDPGNAAYLDSLGWAYFKLKKYAQAETALGQAAGQRRTDSVVQDHHAQVLFELKRYAEAVAAWQRALDGNGQDIDRSAIEARIRAARQKAGR